METMERSKFPVFVDSLTGLTSSSDFYSLGDDSSSDDEAANSSGDEINEDFNRVDEGSDSDSFEKEMEAELNEEFSQYSKHLFDQEQPLTETKKVTADTKEQDSSVATENMTNDTYDEMYFSSGSEADEDNVGGVSSKSKERRTKKTDDELYYDPNMDEEDEKWVKRQRREHHQEPKCQVEDIAEGNVGSNSNGDSMGKRKAIKKSSSSNFRSDAILSCPACLTTLCIDCQRHDVYKQQFRAMFVMNCVVIPDETLRYEHKKQKKKSSKKNKDITMEEPELYNPVQCTSCNTEVAVFDKDEVYHFFNVVESLP